MKKKVIPDNFCELLTPIATAPWVMGEGAILNKGLVLYTDSYSIQEVVKLINVPKIKYDINCTIQGYKNNSVRIHILQESMPKLQVLIKPYILFPLLYKIFLSY